MLGVDAVSLSSGCFSFWLGMKCTWKSHFPSVDPTSSVSKCGKKCSDSIDRQSGRCGRETCSLDLNIRNGKKSLSPLVDEHYIRHDL